MRAALILLLAACTPAAREQLYLQDRVNALELELHADCVRDRHLAICLETVHEMADVNRCAHSWRLDEKGWLEP